MAGLAGHVLVDGGAVDPLIIATLLAPEPTDTIPVPKTLEQAVVAPLRDFFGRNNAWLILLLIVLYKLATHSP
ncbi:peptidoglycan monomer (N-acetylglucosamine-1,6-anhydro-N-acetylmuramic acid-tetrapeptide) uptake protein (major facilitator superfamily protein) [Escherichia coli]|nr:peptidoglycan monomer (N-acetylglucosamine-1,6-anhydro-N-acetylmuramic acid-tetrapeptide) uptake protein (major facilitator superfamily protein) [Escherichia coli]